MEQAIGRYDAGGVAGEGAPPMLRALGRCFRKRVVFVCQPWQTSTCLLLQKQFIPACPPHDGPPGVIYPPP